MNSTLRLLSLLFLLPLCGSCISTSSLTAYVGERSFDDSDIEGVDDQTAVGLEWLWGILPWGLGLELGANYSEEDKSATILGTPVDIDSKVFEGYVGARKTFREDHHLRPYIAAGISYSVNDFDIQGGALDSDDDEGTDAFYGRVGIGYHLALFHFGVDYRVLTGSEVEFAGEDVDVDNALASVFVGISF